VGHHLAPFGDVDHPGYSVEGQSQLGRDQFILAQPAAAVKGRGEQPKDDRAAKGEGGPQNDPSQPSGGRNARRCRRVKKGEKGKTKASQHPELTKTEGDTANARRPDLGGAVPANKKEGNSDAKPEDRHANTPCAADYFR
jgi:hypothetical protein